MIQRLVKIKPIFIALMSLEAIVGSSILMDWIFTIGYWGFIVAYGVIFILGLVMAFGSEPEERKHGRTLVIFLTAPLALAILIAFIVNNFL